MILASFEASNGIIMFGGTTAIVIAAVQRIYFSKEPEDNVPLVRMLTGRKWLFSEATIYLLQSRLLGREN